MIKKRVGVFCFLFLLTTVLSRPSYCEYWDDCLLVLPGIASGEYPTSYCEYWDDCLLVLPGIASGEYPNDVSEKGFSKILLDNFINFSDIYQFQEIIELDNFIQLELVPKEFIFFNHDIGLDEKTGLVYDHVRILVDSGKITQVGNYSAPSKFSLQIPVLLGVIQQKPGFENVGMKPEEARDILVSTLSTISDFIDTYPEYRGFIPWVEINFDGNISPSDNKIPSLDNGQFTWALVVLVSALEESNNDKECLLVRMAKDILKAQDYSNFYDSDLGIVYGAVGLSFDTGEWVGTNYVLNDMFEGTMAVLWGVLNG
ncbi:MAG: hypothetical protein P9L98_05060 [Candidatus Kaelpia imicola]|nr:hypothetical protein [Candidatus Kaelpia imicola]